MKASIADLSDIFGVARSTISAWTKEGMPVVEAGSTGKAWVYDSAECFAWAIENKARRRPSEAPSTTEDGRESYEEAERRKMVAMADKAELDFAKQASLIVPIDSVAAVIAEHHVRIRNRLLAIPNEVRTMVRSFFSGDRKTEEAVVGGVESTILDALKELADPDGVMAAALQEYAD